MLYEINARTTNTTTTIKNWKKKSESPLYVLWRGESRKCAAATSAVDRKVLNNFGQTPRTGPHTRLVCLVPL